MVVQTTGQSVFVDLLENRPHATTAEKTVALFLDVGLTVHLELREHLLQECLGVLLDPLGLRGGLE